MATAGQSLTLAMATHRQLKTLFDPETGQYVEVLLPLANYSTGMIPVGSAHSMMPIGSTPSMMPVGSALSMIPITPGSSMIPVGYTPIQLGPTPMYVGSAQNMIPVGCRMSYHPMPTLSSNYPTLYCAHTDTHPCPVTDGCHDLSA